MEGRCKRQRHWPYASSGYTRQNGSSGRNCHWVYHIGKSQIRQPATSTAYANHHVLAFTQPFLSGMPRTTATTGNNCGRVPAAAAPRRAAQTIRPRFPCFEKQIAASNSALMKPAASMSVTAFVAVIQTTGVISKQLATHHASLSENWRRIIKNLFFLMRRPPPRYTLFPNVDSALVAFTRREPPSGVSRKA